MNKGKILKRPWCPFCGHKVEKATEAVKRKMREFPVGRCGCGAVYTCDPTGHNVGAAMVETLVYACNDNWDLAWELMPEDDYLTGRVENYDEVTHQVVDIKNIDGRPVRGVLYFVRLHTEIAELSRRVSEKKQNNIDRMTPDDEVKESTAEFVYDQNRVREKATKQKVKNLIEAGDIEGLVLLCFDDKKTLRLLQRLLYSPLEDERWYTAWVIGEVTKKVASKYPGQVSELLHRLFEACLDTAATPWGMVETIGCVIAARPDIFGAFTRHLLGFMADGSLQERVIWALAEIAAKRPDLVRDTPFYNLFHFLNHPEPGIRGQVARLLGRIKATEVVVQLMTLHNDSNELTIWEKGKAVKTTVAEEAAKAVAAIHGGEKA
jgi:hypothetical protein